MKKINQAELKEIIDNHKKWLNGRKNGVRANLSNLDLSYTNLRYTDLSDANLTNADLSYADLLGVDLINANLINADLINADLINADLRWANLTNANLTNANLIQADLTNTKGLISKKDYMNKNFKFDEKNNSYIAYKAFGLQYTTPNYWIIEENSIITENCDMDRIINCSYGINCANLDWINDNNDYNLPIWKVLVKEEDICVPYNTDGKFRCKKALLLNIVDEFDRELITNQCKYRLI